MSRLPLARTVVLFFSLSIISSVAQAYTKNGFELDGASVPAREILSGGPPKDGIPAIDRPKFLAADRAGFLKEKDRVLGVALEGAAKAYPIKILDWHEIVNDSIGAQHFAVTYCPLCGTGVAFAADVGGKRLNFGVSGLLYNSDVLLYDRNTESLWSQIMAEAITGEFKGTKLQPIPLRHTTWGDWLKEHPDSLVLSTDTGYRRNYNRSPYGDYAQSRRLYFSVSNRAPAIYHPKEQVMGVEVNGQFKAYPFVELSKQGNGMFAEQFAGQTFNVHWNEDARSAYATDPDGNLLSTTIGFWFAWYTFYPETEVFKAPRN
ncbi:MAG: DUF3179 domain-containing protein [Chromatiales bacterium]|nr:DUF3179 domain-containing protein [Chromatiales bacterium]